MVKHKIAGENDGNTPVLEWELEVAPQHYVPHGGCIYLAAKDQSGKVWRVLAIDSNGLLHLFKHAKAPGLCVHDSGTIKVGLDW